ncbi:hypothetical protein HYZ78_03315 [Candidatus Microgenomates bacterium]|nr:hypothetical protein [Candidatus Microgenomates bacterium]
MKKMHRNMTNTEIAELLRAVAAAYELYPKGKLFNRFRVVAYNNAATAIEHATSELKDIFEEGKLENVPGIGSSIAKYLQELFKTGKVKHFEEVMGSMPHGMFELLGISGIGAKTAYKLVDELGIRGRDVIGEVKKAGQEGKIRGIPGFGEEKEKLILQSINERVQKKSVKERMLLPIASMLADEVVAWMKKEPSVQRVDFLGSLRRQASTVGDVDMAVATDNPKMAIKHFTNFPKKTRVIEAGDFSSSLYTFGGAQVDLMVQPAKAYGALLQHFTGSKFHNIKLREYALKHGMSLSEHGIKTTTQKVKIKKQNYNTKLKIYQFPTEEEFYETLGMDWIPPELREDTGEVEAALKHELPNLVELEDVKGDFHLHSDFQIQTSHDDGTASFTQMIELGDELGYEYMGFSEHNPSQSTTTKQEVIDLIKRKAEAIEKINYSNKGKVKRGVQKVFNGLEIDIRPNGKLALSEEGFNLLDYAIVSVHSSFRQTQKEQTKRVLAALTHPKAKIFGHPTGRKLNQREGIELNWPEIFDFCKKNDKWLEINSWYDRLDLPDNLVREAVKIGVKLIIDTDAHTLGDMKLMRYGVAVARRGWAEKKDIANTLPLAQFTKTFIG